MIDLPISLDTWLIFVVVWFGAVLFPGPSTAYAVASGSRHGPIAALYTAIGFAIAATVYVTLVGMGLMAFLAASAELFEVLRWAGTGYMLYLAWQTWHASTAPLEQQAIGSGQAGRLITRSALVALTNPKAVVFFTMVFAPFITPDAGFGQVIVICGTAVAIEFICYAAIGLFAGRAGRLITTRRQTRARNCLFATLFAGAGAALAFAERR